jgi:hypothetical protein
MKKLILSERNLVVVLFVMVLVIFSLAQEDSKKIEKMYLDAYSSSASSSLISTGNELKEKIETDKNIIPVVQVR